MGGQLAGVVVEIPHNSDSYVIGIYLLLTVVTNNVAIVGSVVLWDVGDVAGVHDKKRVSTKFSCFVTTLC